MKKHVSIALVALLFSIPFVQINHSHSDSRPFIRCPKFVVDIKTGTYAPLRSQTGNETRCSDNAAQLRKQGFQAATGAQSDSILDAPRVITGRGKGYYEKAFRITTTTREVYAEVFDCETNDGTMVMDIRRRSDAQLWVMTPEKTQPLTAAFSTASEYSITIQGARSAVCSYRITIR